MAIVTAYLVKSGEYQSDKVGTMALARLVSYATENVAMIAAVVCLLVLCTLMKMVCNARITSLQAQIENQTINKEDCYQQFV